MAEAVQAHLPSPFVPSVSRDVFEPVAITSLDFARDKRMWVSAKGDDA
ncbi:hypothetical protein C7451_11082 [Blastomonas natatoria]|uniref:Uncharacterized protein n=1 Tax=Blastomonas natatoria TaxID=34015 RepID=A0A2V3UZD4_9SPHN|nr:hypothetical protein C7451_11082 [Blastomonas natatoria]